MPNGLIDDSSLRAHPEGLALSLTLPWYRSLWLSSVSTLRLSVDGEPVDAADLAFELDGVRYALDELPEQSDVLWYLQAHPLLIVTRSQPAALGETHDIEVFGELRLPYMQIAPGADGGPGIYVPNVVKQELTLTVTDRDAARAGARRRRACRAARHRGGPVQARPHALLGQRRVPGGLVSTSRASSTGSPSSASVRASRSSPRRCCRRTRSCPTSSCARGATRSTGTGSTRARSARTSTWAAAATAT